MRDIILPLNHDCAKLRKGNRHTTNSNSLNSLKAEMARNNVGVWHQSRKAMLPLPFRFSRLLKINVNFTKK